MITKVNVLKFFQKYQHACISCIHVYSCICNKLLNESVIKKQNIHSKTTYVLIDLDFAVGKIASELAATTKISPTKALLAYSKHKRQGVEMLSRERSHDSSKQQL